VAGGEPQASREAEAALIDSSSAITESAPTKDPPTLIVQNAARAGRQPYRRATGAGRRQWWAYAAVAAALPLAQPAGHPQNLGVTEIVRRDELRAVIEARAELGADMEPAVIDAFVERLERRLAEGAAESEQSLKRKRDHQKEMVLGAMGISVPLLAIAAIFTGLAGVLVVCGALVVIAYVSTR
jgi:hypothetical protein